MKTCDIIGLKAYALRLVYTELDLTKTNAINATYTYGGEYEKDHTK